MDPFDQKIKKYTVKQKTPKWTKNVLFYLLDLSVTNTIILANIVNSGPAGDSKRYRRQMIERLAVALTTPLIEKRMEEWKGRKFCQVKTKLKNLAIAHGYLKIEPVNSLSL